MIGQHGLTADMPPDIGPVRVKTVTIDKSDNAEGTVQFTPQTITGEHPQFHAQHNLQKQRFFKKLSQNVDWQGVKQTR